MALLVRTWNVFHGNAKPPGRFAFLERMLRLATADRPDVLCLQEVPAWALPWLGGWSGMNSVGVVAERPTLGPFPSTSEIGRRLTALHHGRIRSAVAGQANAVLLAPGLQAVDEYSLALNPRGFRRVQARWLGLGPIARLGWAKERRVCQAVRVRERDGNTLVIGNLHATSYPADQRLADAELLRAATFVDGIAGPTEPVLFCGDLNVPPARSRTISDLLGPEWGFAGPAPGIDQILVRGLTSSAPYRWPQERRRVERRLLSDHAPVDVRVG